MTSLIKYNRTTAGSFEQLYINLRHHEKRIYNDQEVAALPEIGKGHIHKKEWTIRKASCNRLTRFLNQKNRPLKILEVGCGNGWLSHYLSKIPGSLVIGLDINLEELQQARRVFASVKDLYFIHGEISSPSLQFEKFDTIVFAASIQYFGNLSSIVETALQLLNKKGEIHIIDSHFYFSSERKVAQQRSLEYFHEQGFDEMLNFYFHHSFEELKKFNYSVLYNPNSIVNKFFRRKYPFQWIRIRHD